MRTSLADDHVVVGRPAVRASLNEKTCCSLTRCPVSLDRSCKISPNVRRHGASVMFRVCAVRIFGQFCKSPRFRSLAFAHRSVASVVCARLLPGLLALLTLYSPASTFAAAGEKTALVVTTRGVSNITTKLVARRIRRRFVEEMGPLRSSRALQKVLSDMGLAPDALSDPGHFAQAARTIGARHVLDLNVYRTDSQWVLQARLIRASDGRVLRKPRYPFTSMGPSSQRWHAKHIVRMTLQTLGLRPPDQPPKQVAPEPTKSSTATLSRPASEGPTAGLTTGGTQ